MISFQRITNGLIDPSDFDPISVPIAAHILLRHYREHMGIWFSPVRARKNPWSTIHIPIALNTVSELNIWKRASHAKVSVLRSVLAVSAFTLDTEESGFWREVGIRNRTVAKLEMQKCLTKELHGPCRAKYKDTLLALLSLVSISVRQYASLTVS